MSVQSALRTQKKRSAGICRLFSLAGLSAMVLIACGGGGGSSNSTPLPSVPSPPPTSAAPVVTAPEAITVSENRSAELLTVNASDPDGDALTFEVARSGDSRLFEVSAVGVVGALVPLDFDRPQDSNLDNVYDVTIEVSDGINVVSTTVAITVTNMVNDGITKIVGAAGDGFGYSLASSVGLGGAGQPVLAVGTRTVLPINPVTNNTNYVIFADAHRTEESATIFADSLLPEHGIAFVSDGVNFTNDTLTFVNNVDFGESPDGPYVYLEYPYPLGINTGYRKAATFLFEDDLNTLRDRGSPLNITGEDFNDNDDGVWKVRSTMPDAVSTYDFVLYMGDHNGDGIRDFRRWGLTAHGLVLATGELITNDVSGEHWIGAMPTISPGSIVSFNPDARSLPTIGGEDPVAIGDINGDGADDIAYRGVQTIDGEETSVVFIVSGAIFFSDADGRIEQTDVTRPDIYVLVIDDTPQQLFGHIRKGGDFDGDGLDDVLLERSGNDGLLNATVIFGAAIVADDDGVIDVRDFPNESGLHINETRLTGLNEVQVHSIGDISGDGTDDILLSFPIDRNPNRRSPNGESIVYIILGELLSTLNENLIFTFGDGDPRVPAIVAEGGTTVLDSDGFGIQAVRTADVDGDGIPELALSAPFSGTTVGLGEGDGSVYVIPSTRITEAILDGRPLELGNDF